MSISKKLTIKKLILAVLLILFFLFSFNLQGRTTQWLMLIAGACLFYVICNPHIPRDFNAVVLILAMLTYVLFSHGRYLNEGGIVRFIIGVPVLYFAGFLITEKIDFDNTKIIRILMIFAIGFVLYQLLNLVTSYSKMGETRNAFDFWTGQIIQPTNFNSKGLFVVAFAIPVIFYTKHVVLKIALLTLTAYVAIASVLTASRTNLFLLLFAIVLTVLFTLSYQLSALIPKKPITRKKVITLVILLAAVVCVVIKYQAAIVSWFEMSALTSRLSTNDSRLQILNDGRWIFWRETIAMLMENPMGNPNAFYAHNLFLDIGRVSGIIPMFLMIWFYVRLTKNWWNIVNKSSLLEFKTKRVFFVAFIIFFVAFMLEPVLEGRPSEFIAFSFFAGVINSYRKGCKGVFDLKK